MGLAHSLKRVFMGSLFTKILTFGSDKRIIIESSSFQTTHTNIPAHTKKISEPMRDIYMGFGFNV